MIKSGWTGEKHRHSIASRGIKTKNNITIKDIMFYKPIKKDEYYDEYIQSILKWKNEDAKKLALYYMENDNFNFSSVMNENGNILEFGTLDNELIIDSYGNKLSRITISDKPYNYLQYTKLISVPVTILRNKFKFLNDIKTIQWEINKNPFEFKHDRVFNARKETIPKIAMLMVFSPSIFLDSEMIIKIEGNSEKEINEVNKNIDKKLRDIFYLKRSQIKYE